jgi:hypothetical protein
VLNPSVPFFLFAVGIPFLSVVHYKKNKKGKKQKKKTKPRKNKKDEKKPEKVLSVPLFHCSVPLVVLHLASRSFVSAGIRWLKKKHKKGKNKKKKHRLHVCFASLGARRL